MSAVDVLAQSVFEAYSRNSGNNWREHFDPNAAAQWMAQALEEAGVAQLIAEHNALSGCWEKLTQACAVVPKGSLSTPLVQSILDAAVATAGDAALGRTQGESA